VLNKQKEDPVLREVIKWVEGGLKPRKEETKDYGREYQAYLGIFECLKLHNRKGLVHNVLMLLSLYFDFASFTSNIASDPDSIYL
jgi:hypothetical protein